MTREAWAVLGGSATGTAHVSAGIGCQDAHAWFVGGSACCLAVADGAGSRPRAAEGSLAAVASAMELVGVADGSGAPPVDELFDAARARLDRVAAEAGCDVDEFATTLAIVLITEDEVHIGQVGDSIVVVRDHQGVLRAITPAERFEYANETVFLSGDSWRDHLRLERLPHSSVSGIALSTDGLRFKILDDLTLGTPYAPFFEDAFAWFDSDAATSESVARFIDRLDDQSGDDKTLVLASRRAPLARQSDHCVVNRYVSESPTDLEPRAADEAEQDEGDEAASPSVSIGGDSSA